MDAHREHRVSLRRFGGPALLALALVVAGCEPLPPTGDPLKPLPAKTTTSAPRTSPAPSSTGASGGGYDFDEDAGDIETTEELTPTQLLARAQGLEPVPEPRPVPAPAPVAGAPSLGTLGMATATPMRPMQPWDPATALPVEWGVSLVSTVIDTQPPRAILGLPDGTEVFVTPGSFLPEQRLVVMAIGRNAVQLSRIVPQGFSARVETQNLTSLYPSQPVER